MVLPMSTWFTTPLMVLLLCKNYKSLLSLYLCDYTLQGCLSLKWDHPSLEWGYVFLLFIAADMWEKQLWRCLQLDPTQEMSSAAAQVLGMGRCAASTAADPRYSLCPSQPLHSCPKISSSLPKDVANPRKWKRGGMVTQSLQECHKLLN